MEDGTPLYQPTGDGELNVFGASLSDSPLSAGVDASVSTDRAIADVVRSPWMMSRQADARRVAEDVEAGYSLEDIEDKYGKSILLNVYAQPHLAGVRTTRTSDGDAFPVVRDTIAFAKAASNAWRDCRGDLAALEDDRKRVVLSLFLASKGFSVPDYADVDAELADGALKGKSLDEASEWVFNSYLAEQEKCDLLADFARQLPTDVKDWLARHGYEDAKEMFVKNAPESMKRNIRALVSAKPRERAAAVKIAARMREASSFGEWMTTSYQERLARELMRFSPDEQSRVLSLVDSMNPELTRNFFVELGGRIAENAQDTLAGIGNILEAGTLRLLTTAEEREFYDKTNARNLAARSAAMNVVRTKYAERGMAGSLLMDTGEAFADTAMIMGLAAVTGGWGAAAGTIVWFGGGSAGNAYADLVSRGVDEKTALYSALEIGAVEAGSEYLEALIPVGKGVRNFISGKGAKALALNMLSKDYFYKVASGETRATAAKALTRALGRGVVGAAGETATELTSTVNSAIVYEALGVAQEGEFLDDVIQTVRTMPGVYLLGALTGAGAAKFRARGTNMPSVTQLGMELDLAKMESAQQQAKALELAGRVLDMRADPAMGTLSVFGRDGRAAELDLDDFADMDDAQKRAELEAKFFRGEKFSEQDMAKALEFFDFMKRAADATETSAKNVAGANAPIDAAAAKEAEKQAKEAAQRVPAGTAEGGERKTENAPGAPGARNAPSAAFREFVERMPIWTELGEIAPDMDISSDLAAAFGYDVAPEHPAVAEALKKLFARGDSDAALAQILNAYAKSAIAHAKLAALRNRDGGAQESAAAAPHPLALLVEAANACGDFGAPAGEQIDEPAQDETDAPGGIPHADADAIPERGTALKTLRSALLRNQPQLDALHGSAHDLGRAAREAARVLRGKKSLADVDETARALFEAAQRFDGDAKTFADWIASYAAQARAAKKRGETVSARSLADAAFAFAAGVRSGDFSGYEAVRTQVEEEELSEEEKNLVRAVNRVNAMTGGNVRIAFFDGSFNDLAQGWIDKDNVIHVNRNASEGLLKTLGHEFTHSLEANKGYAALKKEILRADGACVGILLARTGFKSLDAYADAVKRLYERELGRTFSDEEISREIFADVCGAALFERDAAALFAVRRQDRTLFARLLDFLKKLLPATRGTKLEREIRDALRRYRDVMFEEKVKEESLKLKEERAETPKDGETNPDAGEKPRSDKPDTETRPAGGEKATDPEPQPAAGSPLSAVSALRDPQGIFYAYAREAGLNYKFPGQYPDFRGVLERVAAKRGVPVETVIAEAEGLLRFAAANPQFSATENGPRETAGVETTPAGGETSAAWSALTPSAENAVRISGEYRVVDLSELHFVDTSDKAQQDEQERNRSGRRTREQVGRMLMNFEGERLTDDRHTDRGAPIYRALEDGTLRSVSGEGRSRLLKEVYEHGGVPEAQYRARVEKFAREHGIKIPDGVKRPVLIRVATDTGGLSWAQLAKASNTDMKSAYSEAEEAHADAREIPKIIHLLSVRSDESILDDKAFVLAFNEAVGAGTQYAQDRKEGFRETLGLRIENALVAYVLGDREAATELFDSPLSLGNALSALRALAADLARLKANDRYDIAPELVAALKAAVHVRTEKERGNAAKIGQLISAYFEQNTIEKIAVNARAGIDLGAAEILTGFFVDRRRSTSLARVLNAYISEVEANNGIDGLEQGLFGEQDWGAKSDLMKRARDKVLDDVRYSLANGAQHSLEDARASTAEERASIEKEAKANGTWLKAPNGKDTKLTPEQWVAVRTKAFKEWFGDWENDSANSSKVVDENGEPKVFYHNTNAAFTEFDSQKNGTHTDAGWLGDGFYFYGDETEGGGYGANKMAVFLNVREPYFASSEENNRLAELNDRDASIEFREEAEGEGYDGVYYNGDLRQEMVVFYPNQIKSATDNVGTYDAGNPDIRYSIGNKRKEQMRQRLNTKLAGATEEQVERTIAEIEKLGEQSKAGGDPKVEKAALHWAERGTIILPEDGEKVLQAVKVATAKGVDFAQYNSPMELINAFPGYKEKEKPINPDTVPTLKRKQNWGNGITVYNVEESEESRQWLRKIINTHLGKDRSPWCLLQGDGEGNLTADSANYWYKTYNKYPKRVAFKDGKLVAFFASNEEPTWWDTNDEPRDGGVPVIGKIPGDELGRSGAIVYSEDGKSKLSGVLWRGNKQNGTYEEWNEEGTLIERTQYKDGKLDGLAEYWHDNGQPSARFNYKDGKQNGLAETWHENGQLRVRSNRKDGEWDGLREMWHDNGKLKLRETYKDGKLDGLREEWDANGNPLARTNYKDGKEVGLSEVWYPNGQIARRSTHEKNGKPVLNEEWYANGQLKHRSNYKNGRLDGLVEVWDEDGNLERRINYKDGRLVDSGGNGIRYSIKAQEQASWDKVLDKYESGEMGQRETATVLGRTPVVLQRCGAADLPIRISKGVLDKVTSDKHEVSVSELRKLLTNLDNPIAVFRSRSRGDSLVVLTELIDDADGNNSVVALHLDAKESGGGHKVNAVASIYGRPVGQIDNFLRSGDALYVHTQKIRAYLRSGRLQLPAEASKRGRSSLLTQDDFTQDELGVVKVNEENRFSLSMMGDEEAAEKAARERRRAGARRKSAKTAAMGSLHDIDARSRRMIQDFIRAHNTLYSDPKQIRRLKIHGIALAKILLDRRLDAASDSLVDAVCGTGADPLLRKDVKARAEVLARLMRENLDNTQAAHASIDDIAKMSNRIGRMRAYARLASMMNFGSPETYDALDAQARERTLREELADAADIEPERLRKIDVAKRLADIGLHADMSPEAEEARRRADEVATALENEEAEEVAPTKSRDDEGDDAEPAPAPAERKGALGALEDTPRDVARSVAQLVLDTIFGSGNVRAEKLKTDLKRIGASEETLVRLMKTLRAAATRSIVDAMNDNVPRENRSRISVVLGKISTETDPRRIVNLMERGFGLIAISTTRATRSQAYAHINRLLRPFARMKSRETNLRRRVNGGREEFLHACFIAWTQFHSMAEAAARMQEIQNELAALGEKFAPTEDDFAKRRKLETELHALSLVGGARGKSVIDLLQVAWELETGIENDRKAHEDDVEATRERNREAYLEISDAAAAAPANPDRKQGALEQLFTGVESFRQRLEGLVRYAAGTTEQRARARIEKMERDTAHAAFVRESMAHRRVGRLRAALERIYGKDLAETLRAWHKADANLAVFSRDGKTALSLAQVANLYAQVRQEHYAAPLRDRKAFPEKSVELIERRIAQIPAMERALGEKGVAVVNALCGELREIRPELRAAFRAVTGYEFYTEENYFPIRRQGGHGVGLGLKGINLSALPMRFSARVVSAVDVAEDISIFDAFDDAAGASEHFIAYSQMHLFWQQAFADPAFSDAIRRHHGEAVLNDLREHVTHILAPETINYAKNRMADRLIAMTAVSALGFNTLVMLRQMTSLPAFMFNMGVGDFAKHFASAATPQGLAAIAEICRNNAWFRARFARAFGDEFGKILAGKGAFSAGAARALAWYMITNNAGDAVPILWIGQGIFRQTYEAALRKGLSEAEARERAHSEVAHHAEISQQSSRTMNASVFARKNSSVAKAVLQFKSTTQQFLSYEVRAFSDVAARPTDAKRWATLGKMLLLNHVILPGLYTATTLMFDALVGDTDDWDDEYLVRFALPMILGPASGIFFVGDAIATLGGGLSRGLPAVELIGKGRRLWRAGEALLDADTEKALDETFEFVLSICPPLRHAYSLYENRVKE